MELEPAIHATKRLRRRLRDPSGFQTNDLPLVLCVLAFLIAVGLASLGRTHHRKELRSFLCLENLLRIERGVAAAELSCPVRASALSAGGRHLGYRHRVSRSRETFFFIGDVPDEHRRLDDARADIVDTNAVPDEIERHVAGEVLDGSLRSVVCGASRVPDDGGDRAAIYDTPPADSIIFGITWREQRNVPRTLTFMTRSQSSSGMSTTVPLRKMPALLKSTVSLA